MRSFERSTGSTAIAVGLAGLLYSVSFVVVSRSDARLGATLAGLFLLLGGVMSVHVMAALYRRLREVDPGFSLTALLFGFGGALGAALHGGSDLANGLHPIAGGVPDLPSAVDPRGLATFGLAGLALLVFARLLQRGGGLPSGLAWLGYLSGVLLVLVYLGRLVVLDASSPLILLPAALEGFVVNPVWYVWLGVALLRR